MASHEDMMFQFDSGSVPERALSNDADLESQLRSTFNVPRGFDDEMLSLDTQEDEQTLFSTSHATTLLGNTPSVLDAGQNSEGAWSRDYAAVSEIPGLARAEAGSSAAHAAAAAHRNRRPDIDRTIVTSHVTTTLDDTQRKHAVRQSHRFSLPNMFQSLRRINPQTHHTELRPSAAGTADDARRKSLNEVMAFSNYNNYLNDCIFDDSVQVTDRERRVRLEQLADKFWLRDGSIDEEMFEESSDEE